MKINIIYILQEESQENLLSVYTGFGLYPWVDLYKHLRQVIWMMEETGTVVCGLVLTVEPFIWSQV